MSDSDSSNGCGCVSLILFIFVMWALFFGVRTPWGKFNIDIFPPAVWDMDKQECAACPVSVAAPSDSAFQAKK